VRAGLKYQKLIGMYELILDENNKLRQNNIELVGRIDKWKKWFNKNENSATDNRKDPLAKKD